MKKISKIVLATEFSATCEAARSHAAALARQTQAELHVLYVQVLHGDQYGWAGIPNVQAVETAVKEMSDSQMSRFVSGLSPQPTTVVRRELSAGPAIIDYADDIDADLIVLGTHARRGVSRLFMGSVASEVIRHAGQPVLVVGPEHQMPEDGYRKILIPTDFSDAAKQATEQAASLAEINAARLALIHVVDDRPLPPYLDHVVAELARDRARKMLDEYMQQHALGEGCESAVKLGRPSAEIIQAAREYSADLIVMGHTGLSALDRLLIGSHAEYVLRANACPVWVHRGDVVGF